MSLAASLDYKPPRRLRHVKSFLVRQLTLPPSSAADALETECFLELLCLPSPAADAAQPPPQPQPLQAGHLSERVAGVLCPEFAAPPCGALAPPGSPPDARCLLLRLLCAAPPAAGVITPPPLVMRCILVDLERLLPLIRTAAAAPLPPLPPNTLLLRLDDGQLYAPLEAEALDGVTSGVTGGEADWEAVRAALSSPRAPDMPPPPAASPAGARPPAAAAQRLTWAEAVADFDGIITQRAAALGALAQRAQAHARAAQAVAAADGGGGARGAAAAAAAAAAALRAASAAAARAEAAAASARQQRSLFETLAELDSRRAALRARERSIGERIEALAAARAGLEAAGGARARLRSTLRALCDARWTAVRDLCAVYPLSSATRGDRAAAPFPLSLLLGGGEEDTAPPAAGALLCIAGVPLGGEGGGGGRASAEGREAAAAALGHAAALLQHLGRLLDVPLRYSLHVRGSRSAARDRAAAQLASARLLREDNTWYPASSLDPPELRAWLPLFTGGGAAGAGAERDGRYAAAQSALQRNTEQLLHAYGMRPPEGGGGGRALLAALRQLCAPGLRSERRMALAMHL